MIKARIQQDSHGLYVRTNGTLFRPQRSTKSIPVADGADNFDEYYRETPTQFSTRELAHIRLFLTCGVLRVVSASRDLREVWHDHGSYYADGGGRIPSDQVWSPARQRTPVSSAEADQLMEQIMGHPPMRPHVIDAD